jgi:hypothetical protein
MPRTKEFLTAFVDLLPASTSDYANANILSTDKPLESFFFGRRAKLPISLGLDAIGSL